MTTNIFLRITLALICIGTPSIIKSEICNIIDPFSRRSSCLVELIHENQIAHEPIYDECRLLGLKRGKHITFLPFCKTCSTYCDVTNHKNPTCGIAVRKSQIRTAEYIAFQTQLIEVDISNQASDTDTTEKKQLLAFQKISQSLLKASL